MSDKNATEAILSPNEVLKADQQAIKLRAGLLLVVGIALCFTGIGAIVGAPLIIAALVVEFIGVPKNRRGLYRGDCPHCAHAVITSTATQFFDCPACKKRVARVADRFETL